MANDGAIPSTRPRHIIILCDGTGKNGVRDADLAWGSVTNIWRLYQAVKPGADKAGDLCMYVPGVGSENFEVGTMLAQMFGHTVVVSIRDIYLTIAQNYKEGDSINLFGYSRGAFIVRKVASLIGVLGLIPDVNRFDKYLESMQHTFFGKHRVKLPKNVKPVPISCVGVWDTVGAITHRFLLRPIKNFLTLPDDDLPDIVQSALHVVAYHENRKNFDVTLWKGGSNDDKWSHFLAPDTNFSSQTLFPGCHSDVGGGGFEFKDDPNILPDITLDWMLRHMPQTITRILPPPLELELPHWYPIKSAFHDGPYWLRSHDSWSPRTHLINKPGLYRHRTLQGLSSPESPYLLTHNWETAEQPGPGRLANRFAATVKQATVFRPRRRSTATAPPVPPVSVSPTHQSPQMSGSIEPQATPPSRPVTSHFRPETSTTDQTDAMTNMHGIISTSRTSIVSMDLPPEQQQQQQHAQAEVCKPEDVAGMGADILDIPTPKAVPDSVPPPIAEEKIEPTVPNLNLNLSCSNPCS
ncbi:hypothetical protein FRC09_005832 [Ceratobasidium sp. 395]|nr:hypothetical protein FRC09_005832 [Ceratobasidium sp. 395]